MDFNNFFRDMMEELDHKVQEERNQREEAATKYAEMKRKNDEAADVLWETYRSLMSKGFTPPQAMELLKTIMASATVGGHK